MKMIDYGSMIATVDNGGTLLPALDHGSVIDDGEQNLYSARYEYDDTGLIPGYQSLATYRRDSDTVVIHFVHTTDGDGYTWTLSDIVYNRMVEILKREARSYPADSVVPRTPMRMPLAEKR